MGRIKLIILLPLLIAGCASNKQPTAPAPPASTPALTACPELRMQVCTMDYRPVCANRDTGVRCVKAPCPSIEQRTYSNACNACADHKVKEHRNGACPGEPINR